MNEKQSNYNENYLLWKKLTIKYMYNTVFNSKWPEKQVHRFEQPLIVQRFPWTWSYSMQKWISCLEMYISCNIFTYAWSKFKKNTIHNSRDQYSSLIRPDSSMKSSWLMIVETYALNKTEPHDKLIEYTKEYHYNNKSQIPTKRNKINHVLWGLILKIKKFVKYPARHN